MDRGFNFAIGWACEGKVRGWFSQTNVRAMRSWLRLFFRGIVLLKGYKELVLRVVILPHVCG